MRQWPLFSMIALVLCLGGCASSTTPGLDARASYTRPAFAVARIDPEGRPRLAVQRSRSAFRRAKARHNSASDQPLVVSTEPKQLDASEPRPNSTAWWLRENVRVGKAIIICKVCLAATISGVSQPKPLDLTDPPSAQAVR
jgi:hypothetical protein